MAELLISGATAFLLFGFGCVFIAVAYGLLREARK